MRIFEHNGVCVVYLEGYTYYPKNKAGYRWLDGARLVDCPEQFKIIELLFGA